MIRQIVKAVLAVILAPFTLIALILLIPISIIAYLNHILDDDYDWKLKVFMDDLNVYSDEWRYAINLYTKIFTFKKNK